MATDFYARGLATGAAIGEMINPSSSGREAYLMATRREMHKQELAKNAFGVEERNGQLFVTPQGEAAYGKDPLLMNMALSNYGPVHIKRQQEAMQLGNSKAELLAKAYGLADKLDAQVDSSAGAPEEKLKAKIANGSVVYSMMKDIFGKDMESPFVKMLVQREEVLTNSQLAQSASIGVINTYINEMQNDPNWTPTFQNQERLSIAYKNLSKADQEVYKPTIDKIMSMKPRQIAAWEAKMDGIKKEQEIALQEAKEKRVIDYRASREKPQKFQLVGSTKEGKPVSYDSSTGKYTVDGQEYTGEVKPRTVNQDVAIREATSLRKEFNALPEVKNFSDIRQKYDVIGEAVKKGITSGNKVAVDQAIITMFNKMMDPQSVVRESEYARTPSDLAMMNRIRGLGNKIAQGGAGLTKDDRKAIFEMSQKFMEASERKYRERLHEYKGYMASYGLDPNVHLNPAAAEKTAVETRVTPDGRKLVKYSDGSIEEAK
jgi:hypothetical protein